MTLRLGLCHAWWCGPRGFCINVFFMLKTGLVMTTERIQTYATRASRLELAIAFLAAALTGGLLNVLQQGLTEDLPLGVQILGYVLAPLLFVTMVIWFVARQKSLDLGVCFVIRDEQLSNRSSVVAALSRACRDWTPVEVVERSTAWLTGLKGGQLPIVQGLAAPLGQSVGEPRVLIAVSASDVVGFVLGHTARPVLLGAEVQLMILPTESEQWPQQRYNAGESVQRGFFERADSIATGCSCPLPKGAGLVHAGRSPDRNSELVIRSLLDDGVICCRGAVRRVAGTGAGVPMSQEQAVDGIRFLRSRARDIVERHPTRSVDLILTCGPEVSMLAGLLLSGTARWTAWAFDRHTGHWETRWTNV